MPYDLSIPGQTSELELKAIEVVGKYIPEYGTVVEVGSLFGRTAYTWGKSAPTSAVIYCIAPWKQNSGIKVLEEKHGIHFSVETFMHYTDGMTNVMPLQGASPKDFLYWRKSVDVYFEDSVHEDPIFSENIHFWSRHMTPEGIICGHDYKDTFPDVMNGVHKLCMDIQASLIVVDSFWCLLRREHTALIADLLRLGGAHIHADQLQALHGQNHQQVTRLDIVYAYRLLLGRMPESEEVIVKKLNAHTTFENMRRDFFKSREFVARFPLPKYLALETVYEPQPVDITVSPEQYDKLLAHIETTWTHLSQKDAFWSVCTNYKYKKENLSEDMVSDFYATGVASVRQIEMALRRCGEEANLRGQHCLEYGCGVGRNLKHLAGIFAHVTGVDISQGHLDVAGEMLEKYKLNTVTLKKISALLELRDYKKVDFIYSVIVLQHFYKILQFHNFL